MYFTVSLESHSNRPVSNSVLESDIQPELPQAGVAEYQPQFVAPTQCTSPPDDKPVKLTFIVTVPNHESNEADLVTEPTDCTSPPDGESIKPTFVVTVRSSSEKAISKKAQPQEFPVDLPGTKHNIPVEVTIMVTIANTILLQLFTFFSFRMSKKTLLSYQSQRRPLVQIYLLLVS